MRLRSLPWERRGTVRGRGWWVLPVVLSVAATGLLGAVLVPVHSESQEVLVRPASLVSTTFSVPQVAWVTVSFSHPGPTAVMYGMDGPSGTTFTHRGSLTADSYSFGTWGGTFHCWVEYEVAASQVSPIWVNVTWGLL